MPICRAAAFAVVLTAFAARAELRTWTLPDGGTLSAELTGIDNGKASLTPSNGRTAVIVSVARLNPTDRAVIHEWVPPGRRGPGANAVVERNAAGWPLSLALKEDPSAVVVEDNRAAKRFVYRSDHFEFTCSEPLNRKIVREFSRLFEVTYETVAALPLRLQPEPPQGYFKVLLYPTKADYVAAGAPEESGGFFRGGTGDVMVLLPHLGVKRTNGDRWIVDSRDGNQPLIHEVTHQVMGAWLAILPVWVSEGAAEYLAAGRLSGGKLTLHADFDNMFTFLTEQKGVSGRDVDMRHPERLMVMDFEKWRRDLASREGMKNYYSAMLLFFYFCHADGDGSGRALIEYFHARLLSKSPYDDKAERERFLLRGRSWKILWEDVQRVFNGHRIKIS